MCMVLRSVVRPYESLSALGSSWSSSNDTLVTKNLYRVRAQKTKAVRGKLLTLALTPCLCLYTYGHFCNYAKGGAYAYPCSIASHYSCNCHDADDPLTSP